MLYIIEVRGGYRIQNDTKIFPKLYIDIGDATKRLDELVRHTESTQ